MAVGDVTENPATRVTTVAVRVGICKRDAILASNTYSSSDDDIAASTNRPDRVIGMHFMNPVPIMTLVEIINGSQTSPEVNAAVVEAAQRIGTTALSCIDSPALVSNRTPRPTLNAAILILQ